MSRAWRGFVSSGMAEVAWKSSEPPARRVRSINRFIECIGLRPLNAPGKFLTSEECRAGLGFEISNLKSQIPGGSPPYGALRVGRAARFAATLTKIHKSRKPPAKVSRVFKTLEALLLAAAKEMVMGLLTSVCNTWKKLWRSPRVGKLARSGCTLVTV